MKNKKGFTLVEVLVAMFLTGLVMVALVGLWMSTVNYAANNKDEIMYKNLFSVAAKTMEADFSTTTFINGLDFYHNIAQKLDNSYTCVNSALSAYVVNYCYNGTEKAIFRTETPIACNSVGSLTPPIALSKCSSENNNVYLVNNIESATFGSGGAGLITVAIEGRILIGKSRRPVYTTFNRTIAYQPMSL